jgi:hypothetical protein
LKASMGAVVLKEDMMQEIHRLEFTVKNLDN